MAGTVTVAEERHSSVHKITFTWTSSGGGAADATTTYAYTGAIQRLVTDPGATAPTPDYDVVINDEDGMDVLMGAGIDRHTSTTEQVLASSLGIVANDKLTLAITGAGDTKIGVVYLYIR